MESEWFDYVEETGVGGNQGRRKKHKSNLEDKDVDHPILAVCSRQDGFLWR
jgi:hypothetical protein